jgi:hypothetical protein
MITIFAICITIVALTCAFSLLFWVLSLKNKLLAAEERVEDAERSKKLYFAQVRKETDYGIKQGIKEFKEAFEKDNVHLISQAVVVQTAKQLDLDIKNVIETKFNRISQEFLGGLTDETEGIARDLQIELAERIWDAFQSYKQIADDSPIIFPEGTRLAYTKGHRTVLVIEQKPQVRTVTFDGELLSENTAKKSVAVVDSGYRYTLAFPYVYFVMVFDSGKYRYHELYFRNKALTSVREHVHLAPIPNVFRDREGHDRPMCMGKGFADMVREETTITRQCEVVISDFWQSTFSEDLGTGHPEKVDKRISNPAKWQENTQKDPLFAISINWPKGKTVKWVIEMHLDRRNQDHLLDPVDNAIRVKLDEGVAKITQRVKEEIDIAKTKGLTPVALSQQSKQILEDTVLGHSNRVFEALSKKKS